MAYKDLLEIMSIIKTMIDTEPDKEEFRKTFMFKKEEYGFVPNLSGISTGEYIDLENYCKSPIENLHIIMSILYRKVTFKGMKDILSKAIIQTSSKKKSSKTVRWI
jgi:hypothetical protein